MNAAVVYVYVALLTACVVLPVLFLWASCRYERRAMAQLRDETRQRLEAVIRADRERNHNA